MTRSLRCAVAHRRVNYGRQGLIFPPTSRKIRRTSRWRCAGRRTKARSAKAHEVGTSLVSDTCHTSPFLYRILRFVGTFLTNRSTYAMSRVFISRMFGFYWRKRRQDLSAYVCSIHLNCRQEWARWLPASKIGVVH